MFDHIIPQLARVLNVDDRLLYRCLRFVREYPILAHGPELGWTHYRLLLDVSDLVQRKALENAARKNHWTAPELEKRVRAVNAIDVTSTTIANGGATSRTHKPDKYERYLADVFLTTDTGEIYLNNKLLEHGQAVRKDAADFGDDWGLK